MKQFDVIVIGGGHAGCEAALTAARLGCRTALITMKAEDIGVMSCNPAIGGLGKGHLVREIDALGGAMGIAADRSGIQFRLLNRTKGPAVRGPRTQSDRDLYKTAMREIISAAANLEVIVAEVKSLAIEGTRVVGVVTADEEISATRIILTTGTFLGGTVHIGDQQFSGGRIGDGASTDMARQLRSLNLPMGRLKTGTPPRLSSASIDWDRVGRQAGDETPSLFSFLSTGVTAEQVSCGVTETNPNTHEIIRANLARSAMYGGHIEGVGPRYCPSIEDKVTRFADKNSHLVYLEPEGLTSDVIYPNGISTSLPEEVQQSYVRSIKGLENAEILQPGYAIEYDFVNPQALSHDLSLKALDGLYLAGQINGTTGYEEAAAQGLVAGLNAARASTGQGSYRFSRSASYIGVMIDDLVSHGVSEPYRMFTSRAEFRLVLRADNADRRLTPEGRSLGLVNDGRWEIFSDKVAAIDRAKKVLAEQTLDAASLSSAGVRLNTSAERRSALDALRLADCDFATLQAVSLVANNIDPEIGEQVRNDALYEHYAERQLKEIAALQSDEQIEIPQDFPVKHLSGLSNELQAKIERSQPRTWYDLKRIEGMTPAALIVIQSALKKLKRAG